MKNEKLNVGASGAVCQVFGNLGIPRDGVLFLHASFRVLSKAGYDAHDFTSALVEYMAPGTLLMPSMSWRAVNLRNPFFDELETPGITGIISETFRNNYATHRSLHPTHSVSGCGRMAEVILGSHHLDDTPCSKNSPFGLLPEFKGYVVLMGVGMERCTLIHYAEEKTFPDLYLRPKNAREPYICRDRYGRAIEVFTRRHYRLERDFSQFEELLIAQNQLQTYTLEKVKFQSFMAHDLVELVSEELQSKSEIIFARSHPSPLLVPEEQGSSIPSQDMGQLRAFNFVVVFWGKKFRDFFLAFCLPSLLAPNNVPLLKGIMRGRLIICSTKDDWDEIQSSILVGQVKEYLELVFLDIGYPGEGDLPQLHMSKGHKLGIQWVWEKGEYGIFLAPDLVLSDGTIAKIIGAARAGKKAVLAVALRYDMDKCVNEFKLRGLLRSDEALVLPPRVLADIAATSLHSEIQRFNWDSPHFCNYPISVYFPVPNDTGIVVNSCSWAMVLVDFNSIATLKDDSLDSNTIDAHFVHQNLYQYRRSSDLELITDSDEMLFVSLTPEADLSFYPLARYPINDYPRIGPLRKFFVINLFLYSRVMDPYKRWAFGKSFLIHGGEVTSDWKNSLARSERLSKWSVGKFGVFGIGFYLLGPIIYRIYLFSVEVREIVKRNLEETTQSIVSIGKVGCPTVKTPYVLLMGVIKIPHVILTLVVKKIVAKKEFQQFMSEHPGLKNFLIKVRNFLRVFSS